MASFNASHDQIDENVTKEAWVKPEVAKISAGDAEFGATPLVPEGAFGFGS